MKEKVGLEPHTLRLLNSVFKKNPLIEQVILYGSRARLQHKPSSDIDLTILAQLLNVENLYQIERDLDELMLPYNIDLSLYHLIDDKDLLEKIRQDGVTIYWGGQN